ncbi:MAG TPA: glutamine-hydrolyzing carbamoyl-phosphate synthase small subunit [Anaerolineaceae bacterium]
MNNATLTLQDGTIIEGTAFGAHADAVFELVFNTSQTGYQEILTDPSYRGQGVLFTVSHLGNTGINQEDNESVKAQVSAVVVRSVSPVVSSWRATTSLPEWMKQARVPGICGIDTRFLTQKLRDGGTQKAALSTCGTSATELLKMARDWEGLDGRDMVKEVSCRTPYTWQADPGSSWVPPHEQKLENAHIVAYDYGIKHNILRQLSSRFGRITVVPAATTAAEALAMNPDGIFLSNGPGDPAGLPYAVEAVKTLINSNIPIFGICLGHQLIGRAINGDTGKLKFGHHGGNHPVFEHATRRSLITAQNHNYAVLPETLDQADVEISHTSLNDMTVEGMRLKKHPVFSVQFHPEAAPGPHDAFHLFDRFREMVAEVLHA